MSFLEKSEKTKVLSLVSDWIKDYKLKAFPQSATCITEAAADWDTEIGGLAEPKEKIEEIFGVAQKYSIFFKG